MNNIEKFIISIFISVLLLVVCSIHYASYFGFDFSDESFYAIGYLNNSEPKAFVSFFHRIYRFFFNYYDFSLPQIRLLRLYLTLGSSFFLAFSFIRFFRSKLYPVRKFDACIIYLIISFSSLLSYTWGPLTLSYNSFSFIFLMLSLSVWFLIHLTNQLNVIKNLLLGFCLGLSFYNKLPNFVLLLGFLPLISLFFRVLYEGETFKLAFIKTIFQFLFVISGSIFCIILLFDFNFSFDENINKIINGFTSIEGDESYSIKNILKKYLKNIIKLFKNNSLALLIIILSKLIFEKLKLNLSLKIRLISGFLILFFISLIYFKSYYLSGSFVANLTFEIHFLIIVCTYLFSYNEFQSKQLSIKILFLFIISLSFLVICAFGTNNRITAQFMFYMSFLYISMSIAIVFLKQKIKMVIIITFIFISTAQIILGVYYLPYRQAIITNKFKVSSSFALRDLKIDQRMIRLAHDLEFIKQSKINYLFTFKHHLGLNLLLDKTPYSYAYFSNSKPSLSCQFIALEANKTNKEVAFIFPKSIKLDSEIVGCLAKNGIDFYSDYKCIKSVSYYDYDHNKLDTLNIFFHKNLVYEKRIFEKNTHF